MGLAKRGRLTLSTTPKWQAKDALLFGLPALSVCGASYYLGFFSTAGLGYFSFLSFQDFVVASAKTLPPFAAYVIVLLTLTYAYSRSRGAQTVIDATAGLSPKEALTRLGEMRNEDHESIPELDRQFKNKDGSWNEKYFRFTRITSYITTFVWFATVALLLAGVRVPAAFVVIALLAFFLYFMTLSVYYDYRYEQGFNFHRDLVVLLVGAVFAWGVWEARQEETSEKTQYTVYFEQKSTAVPNLRRVGDSLLFFDRGQQKWLLLPRSSVIRIEQGMPTVPEKRRK